MSSPPKWPWLAPSSTKLTWLSLQKSKSKKKQIHIANKKLSETLLPVSNFSGYTKIMWLLQLCRVFHSNVTLQSGGRGGYSKSQNGVLNFQYCLKLIEIEDIVVDVKHSFEKDLSVGFSSNLTLKIVSEEWIVSLYVQYLLCHIKEKEN